MWEITREDGSRRLKNNAVPTIFSFSKMKQQRKQPMKRVILHDVSEVFINEAELPTPKEDPTVAIMPTENVTPFIPFEVVEIDL